MTPKKTNNKQKTINVRVKKLYDNSVMPFYAHKGDAGMDVVAYDFEYKKDLDCYVYHTGLSFQLPEGYVMLIYPRSSNRKTDAYLCNSVGVLDSGYTGELLVCFKNRDALSWKNKLTDLWKKFIGYSEDALVLERAPYQIGERIAQIMIVPYPYVKFQEVQEFDETERGDGGFGSTGSK